MTYLELAMIRASNDSESLTEDLEYGDIMNVKFVHESGFNSIQGKYSLICNTRGLVMSCENYCENAYYAEHEVKDMSDNALRFDEHGGLVYPPERPQPPKPLKTENWKRITPKRREKILQYEIDKEGYEIALAMYYVEMAKYLALPPLDVKKKESILNDMEEQGRLVRGKDVVLWKSLPQHVGVVFHKAHFLTWEESLKFNPDKVKVNPQTTLDGVVRFAPPLRTVDASIIKSFGLKPNHLLEREWLLHILNGKKLSTTCGQLLKSRKEAMRGY